MGTTPKRSERKPECVTSSALSLSALKDGASRANLVSRSDPTLHGGDWFRIHFAK